MKQENFQNKFQSYKELIAFAKTLSGQFKTITYIDENNKKHKILKEFCDLIPNKNRCLNLNKKYSEKDPLYKINIQDLNNNKKKALELIKQKQEFKNYYNNIKEFNYSPEDTEIGQWLEENKKNIKQIFGDKILNQTKKFVFSKIINESSKITLSLNSRKEEKREQNNHDINTFYIPIILANKNIKNISSFSKWSYEKYVSDNTNIYQLPKKANMLLLEDYIKNKVPQILKKNKAIKNGILYSGPHKREEAEHFANKNTKISYYHINNTEIHHTIFSAYKITEDIEINHIIPLLTTKQKTILDHLISKYFAENLQGNVTAFINPTPDENSYFIQDELPIILNNEQVKTINKKEKFNWLSKQPWIKESWIKKQSWYPKYKKKMNSSGVSKLIKKLLKKEKEY